MLVDSKSFPKVHELDRNGDAPPLHQQVRDRLMQLIDRGSLRAGRRLWGERQIAEQFSISRNTARLAMRDLEQAGLIERITGRGTFVKSRSPADATTATSTVGVIVPMLDYFYPPVIRAMEESLREQGMRIVVSASNDDPAIELDDVLSMRKERGLVGLIVAPARNSRLFEQNLDHLPLVLIDHANADAACDCVLSDHFGGGYAATAALIELGHRRIACAMNDSSIGANASGLLDEARQEGYRRCMEDRNLGFDPELTRPMPWFDTSTDEEFAGFFKSDNHPTAVFASNDHSASLMMTRLRKMGLQVPDDVAVIGYDDEPFAATLLPALASVRPQKQEMGARAVELLIDRLQSNRLGGYRKIVLKPEIVMRESAGRGPATFNGTSS